MADAVPTKMTSHAFIAWAMEQPDGQRYELHAGVVVAMAPKRSAHALAKAHLWLRLYEATLASGSSCDVYPDGMSVEIDAVTIYEPDVLVRGGPRVPPDTIRLTDPVIVVEAFSLAARAEDVPAKLVNYLGLPSVHQYLIVPTDDRAVVHHARSPDGTVLMRIVGEETLDLDPPGLTVSELFPSVA